MNPAVLVIVLIATTILAFWILPWLCGMIQKRSKKEPLADANDGYSSDHFDPGGQGGDGATH